MAQMVFECNIWSHNHMFTQGSRNLLYVKKACNTGLVYHAASDWSESSVDNKLHQIWTLPGSTLSERKQRSLSATSWLCSTYSALSNPSHCRCPGILNFTLWFSINYFSDYVWVNFEQTLRSGWLWRRGQCVIFGSTQQLSNKGSLQWSSIINWQICSQDYFVRYMDGAFTMYGGIHKRNYWMNSSLPSCLPFGLGTAKQTLLRCLSQVKYQYPCHCYVNILWIRISSSLRLSPIPVPKNATLSKQ